MPEKAVQRLFSNLPEQGKSSINSLINLHNSGKYFTILALKSEGSSCILRRSIHSIVFVNSFGVDCRRMPLLMRRAVLTSEVTQNIKQRE
jgi:hypothetical protein